MGQRLVVTVRSKDEDVCKIYYHWSGYSISSLAETKRLVDFITSKDSKDKKELQLNLIRHLESSGGGINGYDEEFAYIKQLFPDETFKTEDYSRNYGLIALSEKGMEDMQSWSEGDITIDIDKGIIFNEVYYYYNSIDEYIEEIKEWNDDYIEGSITLDKIKDIGCSLYE